MIGISQAGLQHRAFALIMVLLLIVLLIATTSQLATVTAVDAVAVSRQANTLNHKLALESAVRVAAQRVRADPIVTRDLDRIGYHTFDFGIGECRVRCRMVDDGAKFDVEGFAGDEQAPLLKRKLQSLARSFDLADTRVRLRPLASEELLLGRRFAWYDQLFGEVAAGKLLRVYDDDARIVWSDLVTCFGSGRVDLRRARPEVLAVLFDDLDRSIARKIVALREEGAGSVMPRVLSAFDGDLTRAVQARIGYDLNRYALEITTTVRADCRRWYVVATINEHRTEVHYQGQVRW